MMKEEDYLDIIERQNIKGQNAAVQRIFRWFRGDEHPPKGVQIVPLPRGAAGRAVANSLSALNPTSSDIDVVVVDRERIVAQGTTQQERNISRRTEKIHWEALLTVLSPKILACVTTGKGCIDFSFIGPIDGYRNKTIKDDALGFQIDFYIREDFAGFEEV